MVVSIIWFVSIWCRQAASEEIKLLVFCFLTARLHRHIREITYSPTQFLIFNEQTNLGYE